MKWEKSDELSDFKNEYKYPISNQRRLPPSSLSTQTIPLPSMILSIITTQIIVPPSFGLSFYHPSIHHISYLCRSRVHERIFCAVSAAADADDDDDAAAAAAAADDDDNKALAQQATQSALSSKRR